MQTSDCVAWLGIAFLTQVKIQLTTFPYMKIPTFTAGQSTNEINFTITKADPSLAHACYVKLFLLLFSPLDQIPGELVVLKNK